MYSFFVANEFCLMRDLLLCVIYRGGWKTLDDPQEIKDFCFFSKLLHHVKCE